MCVVARYVRRCACALTIVTHKIEALASRKSSHTDSLASARGGSVDDGHCSADCNRTAVWSCFAVSPLTAASNCRRESSSMCGCEVVRATNERTPLCAELAASSLLQAAASSRRCGALFARSANGAGLCRFVAPSQYLRSIFRCRGRRRFYGRR